MRKLLFFICIFLNFSFAFDLDMSKFEDRQEVLQDIRKLIVYEELVAKAYETFLIENYSLPTTSNITDIVDTDNGIKKLIKHDIYNDLDIDKDATKFSYGLKTIYKKIEEINNFYKDNSFRKNTYVQGDSIYFILKDDFAKHLFDLISHNIAIEQNCEDAVSCIQKDTSKPFNDHIYIDIYERDEDDIPLDYLMAYHKDNFKTGPIIITTDRIKQTTNPIFNSIPKGALMYDLKGVKYVKTKDTIEILK